MCLYTFKPPRPQASLETGSVDPLVKKKNSPALWFVWSSLVSWLAASYEFIVKSKWHFQFVSSIQCTVCTLDYKELLWPCLSAVHPVRHRGAMLKHSDQILHTCYKAFSYMVFSKILTFWSSAEARTVVQTHFYICSPLITFHFLALSSVPVLSVFCVQAFGRLLWALSCERLQSMGAIPGRWQEHSFDHLNSNKDEWWQWWTLLMWHI